MSIGWGRSRRAALGNAIANRPRSVATVPLWERLNRGAFRRDPGTSSEDRIDPDSSVDRTTIGQQEEERRWYDRLNRTVPTNRTAVPPPASSRFHARRPATRALSPLDPGADSVPSETPQHRSPLSVPVGGGPEPSAPRDCTDILDVQSRLVKGLGDSIFRAVHCGPPGEGGPGPIAARLAPRTSVWHNRGSRGRFPGSGTSTADRIAVRCRPLGHGAPPGRVAARHQPRSFPR